MLYLLSITLGLCVTYFILYLLFPFFFKNSFIPLTKKSVFSITCIILFSFAVYFVSFQISSIDISNRFLHIFGGGFLSFFVCFSVVNDSGLRLNKFQFLVFSFLIVIALGVANEIVEFFLQNYFHFVFARTVNDTWLDLLSNLIGALIASVFFVPFVHD